MSCISGLTYKLGFLDIKESNVENAHLFLDTLPDPFQTEKMAM
jgi:hypothetical protein